MKGCIEKLIQNGNRTIPTILALLILFTSTLLWIDLKPAEGDPAKLNEEPKKSSFNHLLPLENEPDILIESIESEFQYPEKNALPAKDGVDLACLVDEDCNDSDVCTDDSCTLGPENVDPLSDTNDGTFMLEGTIGNILEVTSNVLMTAYSMELSFTGTENITVLVYESDTRDGTYTTIYTETVPFTGSGGGETFTFDNLAVPFLAGKYYGVAFSWSTNGGISMGIGHTTTSDPLSFGNRIGEIDSNTPNLATFTGASLPLPVSEGWPAEITTLEEGLCEYSNNTSQCDDGIRCTENDICADGSCSGTPNNTLCDNEAYCDGVEICHPVNGCEDGPDVDCDDGVDCTDDSCNEQTDQCDNDPNNAFCNDFLECNGVETCDTVNDCQPGTPVDCGDGVDCTIDTCVEDPTGKNEKYSCDNTADDSYCNDNLWCNGVETCNEINDCQAGTSIDCDDSVECTDDSCDDVNDQCVNDPNDSNCDDGIDCTNDTCDAIYDCQSVEDDSYCDDGLWCNGTETCDMVYDCQAGTSVDCNDGVVCTDDSCDDINDECVNDPNDTNCNDGVDCTNDTCDATNDCQFTANHSNCDDGLWCNGTETCDAVNDCQEGTSVDCDDGVDCTDDSCDDVNDECVNDPNDANCNDGVDCTNDTCDATNGCQFLADDTNCDDGLWCNGTETCDAINDCQEGLLVDCPDDKLFCNGTEFCDEENDECGNTGNPCNSDQTCDEEDNICEVEVGLYGTGGCGT